MTNKEDKTTRDYEREIHKLRRSNYELEEAIVKVEVKLQTWRPTFQISAILLSINIIIRIIGYLS